MAALDWRAAPPGGHRGEQRDPPGGPGRKADPGGNGHPGEALIEAGHRAPPAPDPDDHPHDHPGPAAAGPVHRRGFRRPGPIGTRGGGGPDRLHPDHPGADPDGLRLVSPGPIRAAGSAPFPGGLANARWLRGKRQTQ